MNTICQDRTRTSAALSYARIDPHQPANTHNGYPLATAGMDPLEYAETRKSLRKQVGKTFANLLAQTLAGSCVLLRVYASR